MSAGRVMDATSFVLCAECLEKYRALRFDPDANYALNVMPLCSLVWPDEHPGREMPSGDAHRACKGTIIRLAGARTRLPRECVRSLRHARRASRAKSSADKRPRLRRPARE